MEKDKKTKKVICPSCNGNGYIKIPYHLAKEERVAQCTVCESEGEVDETKMDSIIIDADGFHRLQ
jgi:DnaJ-class molecular chaperone